MVAPSSGQQTVLRAAALASLTAPLVLAASSPDWNLSTNELNRTAWQRQPYVANGYISQRIPAEGFGYRVVEPILLDGDKSQGTNGWPLFDPRFTAAMVAGFYDLQPNTTGANFPELRGGEQPISTLPTWSSLYLTVNNETYDISTPDSQISNWTQSQSIQDGVVETSLNWMLQSNRSVNVKYTLFAHRAEPNLGVVRLDVSGLSNDSVVAVTDVLDGVGAWRTDFVESGVSSNSSNTIYTAVRPNGISNVTAYETSVVNFLDSAATISLDNGTSCYPSLTTNASTISQCYRLSSIPSSGSISVVKYVGIASSDAFNGTEFSTALGAAQKANWTGYSAVLDSHRQAWNDIWDSGDIVIPGEDFEELQYATRASLFHLLSNVRPGNEPTGLGDNSIAPAGITSDSYAGQVFWDAVTWMYPALLALSPDYAESIVDFHHRQLGAAIENAKEYGLPGALYPWTAGRFGNCTSVGPCHDYEYHYNADIALGVQQYYSSTQNKTWLEETGWPIVEAVSNMFASFVQYDNTTGKYSTYNMTSPDEYSNHKNNSVMTNGAIQVTLRNAQALAQILGKETPSNWTDIADNITILVDPSSNIHLEFDGFNGTTLVKQADVVLLTYPFQFNQSKTQALLDLDFYSLATSPNGPGMTRSIFSIDAAELSHVGCATWSYFLGSAQPYARLPYYQFSEQTIDVYSENGGGNIDGGTNPAFTFLTGHGGYLQTLTHGFTGFRSRLDRMYLDPLLPPQLEDYTLKGFKWGGASFDIHLTSENTTITRKESSDNSSSSIKIEVGSRNEKAGNYTLAPGESLTIPTSMTTGTLIENNIAQCMRVISNDTSFQNPNEYIVPGEYALAAVDGANATFWQPKTPEPATLSVDLSRSQNISGMHINWGNSPPLTYTVMAGDSLDNMTALVSSASVEISAPYDAAAASAVSIKIGNLTDVQLESTVQARYVNLTIEGSRDGERNGGTVSEFAVLK
ncbi:alpha,alpha-trehalase ATH1 [Sporobolomyces salmoneus]|uniref:alpha,alpha-trehalase ATH1 n=1 Tax=Sporobolomyces salmoneus TaxID=183962 RepID=UPI0031786F74